MQDYNSRFTYSNKFKTKKWLLKLYFLHLYPHCLHIFQSIDVYIKIMKPYSFYRPNKLLKETYFTSFVNWTKCSFMFTVNVILSFYKNPLMLTAVWKIHVNKHNFDDNCLFLLINMLKTQLLGLQVNINYYAWFCSKQLDGKPFVLTIIGILPLTGNLSPWRQYFAL